MEIADFEQNGRKICLDFYTIRRVWCKNLNIFFFHFVTIHAFDRRADGQTDRILIARPRLHSMQRGKNLRAAVNYSSEGQRSGLTYRTNEDTLRCKIASTTVTSSFQIGLTHDFRI